MIEDKKRRVYAAMVDVMDRGIGEIVTALKEAGEYENTLIFFLSDNGGPQPSEKNPNGGNGSSNAPFRGGKGFMFDGGIHVPFMACWPAKIKAGTRYDYPVCAIDISRTAVAAAGGDAKATPEMEGVDLVPFVTGEKRGAPHDVIMWRGGNSMAVIDSKGNKLLKHGKRESLYNLKRDVSESDDLIAKSTKQADELRDKWNEWNESNIPCNMLNYTEYIKLRNKFFEEAVPGGDRYNAAKIQK